MFFQKAVQPFCWFAAVFLFLSYIIGLWFTLRTHAAVIWTTDADEKKAVQHASEGFMQDSRPANVLNGPSAIGGDLHRNSIRDYQLYKRILGHSLQQVGLGDPSEVSLATDGVSPYLVPPLQDSSNDQHRLHLSGLTEEENESLARQVAEVAATAAAVAARDSSRSYRKASANPQGTVRAEAPKSAARPTQTVELQEDIGVPVDATHASGGHDAPNWGKLKSSVILLVSTILYAVIAEMLVNTVDVVLDNVDIDEKFLGITLFALVPNTTEFLVTPLQYQSCLVIY
jgi:Ca2+:H+ antiporter